MPTTYGLRRRKRKWPPRVNNLEYVSEVLFSNKLGKYIFSEGGGLHPQMVPYDLLTDKEKRKDRERTQELLKYLQFMSYKLHRLVRHG